MVAKGGRRALIHGEARLATLLACQGRPPRRFNRLPGGFGSRSSGDELYGGAWRPDEPGSGHRRSARQPRTPVRLRSTVASLQTFCSQNWRYGPGTERHLWDASIAKPEAWRYVAVPADTGHHRQQRFENVWARAARVRIPLSPPPGERQRVDHDLAAGESPGRHTDGCAACAAATRFGAPRCRLEAAWMGTTGTSVGGAGRARAGATSLGGAAPRRPQNPGPRGLRSGTPPDHRSSLLCTCIASESL